MSNVSRVGRSSQLQPIQKQKYKQDTPKENVVYSNVMRSEGDPEETIEAIIHFAKKQIEDKEEGKGGKKKKKKKKEDKKKKKKFDENKSYVISSPVPETMQQPRKNGCAPTCLAMLLRKYGLVANVKQGYAKVEGLRTQGVQEINDTGMSLENISKYSQMLGLKSRVQRGDSFLYQLEGILRSLNRGCTPIASIQLPGMGSMRHAVLVIGVSNEKVTVIDPAKIEVVEMNLHEFSKAWGKQGKGSFGVGLAYVEVWGPKPQGQVTETLDWMFVFDEFMKDKVSLQYSNMRKSDVVPVIKLFPDFEEEDDDLATKAERDQQVNLLNF